MGGGDACNSGKSRSQLLNLIEGRLDVLNNGALANLCLSVGGTGCGGGSGNGGGGGVMAAAVMAVGEMVVAAPVMVAATSPAQSPA